MLLLQRAIVLRVALAFVAGTGGLGTRQAAAQEEGVARCTIPLALLVPGRRRTIELVVAHDGSCEVARHTSGRRAPSRTAALHRARIRVVASRPREEDRARCFFFSGRTYCE